MVFDVEKLSHLLRDQFPDILFAYLFGSAKEGVLREGGDLDLAVYIQTGSDQMQLIPGIVGLVEEMAPGFSCDLVILNHCGTLLAFEILSGQRLFARESALDIFAHFFSLTAREYEDQIVWMKKQLTYRGHEVQWDN